MALQKTITTDFGIDATYHKIAQLNINPHERQSHIEMLSFTDQQARIDGHQPLRSFIYDWIGDEYPYSTDEASSNFIEQAYIKIKTLPEWEEALDI